MTEEAAGEPVHTQLRRGSLAGHSSLARTDPAHDSEELESQFLIAGVDLEELPARELRAHLLRFFAAQKRSGSTLGAILRASSDAASQHSISVQRAVAYLVTVPSHAVMLRAAFSM